MFSPIFDDGGADRERPHGADDCMTAARLVADQDSIAFLLADLFGRLFPERVIA
jgi:hypothetical protein